MSQSTTAAERGWTHPASPAPACPAKPQRRLKPEVAARLVTRRAETPLEDLYQKPVKDLSPQELAVMRAAFFKG